ncbi:amidohydrolase [Microbacterium sp. SORGH_AS_0888]|uniref:amidohydrolase n=1 Tax=Microbacterium sp. SORGH_AS_0888 TaxID=3041791 RepID=UPI0027D92198|nr:amidohydrolase [Microbacterium sp. SORGH_AS_0888]
MREQDVVVVRAARVFSPGAPDAEAIAMAGGRVLATGGSAELLERFRTKRLVDVGDRTIVPGFNDAHAHFADTVHGHREIDVSAARVPDVAALLSDLRGAAAGVADWVMASGYDDASSGPLDRDMIDAVIPEKPVLVRHVSSHWAVLNTAAMRALDISEDEADIPGGTYGRDLRGRLTGHVYERALLARYVSRDTDALTPIPLAEPGALLDLYEQTAREWNAHGITSACDAFVGPRQLAMHTAAKRAGVRRIRVNMLLAAERYDDLRSLGLGTEMGDEWLRIAGIKAFVDGAIGGRTCLVSEPFCGTHDHGMEVSSVDELAALVTAVHDDGNRLAVHANGDAAIRRLLDAFEAAQARNPLPTRHRIEHCSIVDRDIIARIARLGVMVTPFARYASFYGQRLERWYGSARTERMFAHRSFLDAGVTVGASTDHPASPLSPLGALQSMVTRAGVDGVTVGGSQAITVEEALAVYTIGSARTTGEAGVKGRLEPGYLADFAVLDRDPRVVPPEEIASVNVVATYVGGEPVFEAA